MRRHILLGFQFGRQFRHRDVRRCLDPLEQSRQMRCQLAAAGWAALSRRLRRARSRHPIGQLHRKACTDIVATSRATSRLPALNFGLNAFPKVNRIWLSHPYWPPGPASILNQTSDSLGIPFRFLFQARRSRGICSRLRERSTALPTGALRANRVSLFRSLPQFRRWPPPPGRMRWPQTVRQQP